MIIRSIDGTQDWQFGQGKQNYKTNQAAIAENIQTRLMSFLNDCWFDLGAGIDWFRLLGTPGTKEEIVLTCRSKILLSYGVLRVNDVSLLIDSNKRSLTLSMNIDTIFTNNFLQSLEVAL